MGFEFFGGFKEDGWLVYSVGVVRGFRVVFLVYSVTLGLYKGRFVLIVG